MPARRTSAAASAADLGDVAQGEVARLLSLPASELPAYDPYELLVRVDDLYRRVQLGELEVRGVRFLSATNRRVDIAKFLLKESVSNPNVGAVGRVPDEDLLATTDAALRDGEE